MADGKGAPFQSLLISALFCSWWLCIATGFLGSIALLAITTIALVRLHLGFNRQGICFASLCLLYMLYWSVGGILTPPYEGYADALGRIVPVGIIGILAASLTLGEQKRRIAWIYWGSMFATVILLMMCGIEAYHEQAYHHIYRLKNDWYGFQPFTDFLLSFDTPYAAKRRVDGYTYGNSLLVGYALFIGGIIPLAAWHYSTRVTRLFMILIGIACITVITVLIQARALAMNWLLLAGICSVVLAFVSAKNPRQWLYRIVILGGAILLMGIVCWYVAQIWQPTWSKRLIQGITQIWIFSTQGLSGSTIDNSFSTRITLWIEGLKAFQNHPLLGYGIQHRMEAIASSVSPYGRSYSHLHNSYINHMVGGGLVGLFLYLAIQFYPLWHWIITRLYQPTYWICMDKGRQIELFWLGLFAMLCPALAGLSNVVVFESTLATLSIFPLALWVMRLPPTQPA